MREGGELETVRKWLHLAPGLLAFAVRDLGWSGSIALTAGLLAFNLWLLPRVGGRRLWRREEWSRGVSEGMILYPAALLVVAVATRGRPEVLAGAWGMLAFGDAAATLVGRRFGHRPLPWNRVKSFEGAAAFTVVAWVAVVVLVAWTAPGRYSGAGLATAALLTALAGALLESLRWRMDDNLSVTVPGAAVLAGCLIFVEGAGWLALGPGALPAIVVTALLARMTGALDGIGAVVGGLLAVGVWAGGGFSGFLLLALFVAVGTAATRWRRRRRGGATADRSVRNVLANGAVAAACGAVAAGGGYEPAVVAMVAALAAATADTVGGEIGRAIGGPTRRLPDWRPVPPGTDGGVSWAGSAATLAGAALIALVGVAVQMLDGRQATVVLAAAAAGALLDSLLGGTLERYEALDNEGVNLLSTLAAAWAAAALS